MRKTKGGTGLGAIDSAAEPRVCSARIGALPQPFAYAGPPTRPHIGARPRGGGRVPVTARLSKRFYDVFGEEIANELVNWFNQVDDTYRGDLRELNELNFSRFDAKLEQRLAESDAGWERRLAELDGKWGGRWTQLDARLEQRLAEVKSDLVKWMFAFWAPTALGVVSLLLLR